MRTTFEQPLSFDPNAVLGADGYERCAVFNELSREYGQAICYRTFYGWCRTLKIPSGRVLYPAREVFLLLTLVWARFGQGYRGLSRPVIESLQENYASSRINRTVGS
jgi:hypothetical protein